MTRSYLTLQSGSALVRVPLESVSYLESARHYLVIHAVCGTFRLRERISAYAERLQGKGFTRIHRCYVVNEAWVRARTATAVELAGGEILPIGRRFRIHADA